MSIKNIPQSLIDAVKGIVAEERSKYFEEEQAREKLVAEKMLSPKQKKIASMAGHTGKIDAADFHALRTGKQVKEASDMPEKPFKYNKKTGTFDRVKKMEEEVDLIDEGTKPLESHDITSLAKMHAQHVLRQEGASVARPKHSFKDVSDTIKKKYGNTVHKLVGLHSEHTVDDYTGRRSQSHDLRNKINSTLKKNRSSESIQHEPFNKLTRSEFNEEVDLIDEISKETKKDFKARQERLAAASAQTAKDPARLARLSKIPGYTAAMDLAKKTTQKEEVEQVYEAVKPLESHDITSLAKMHAQHVLRQEGASVARPKHSFKDVSDTIKKKYGNTVHKLVGLHSENTVDDYTGSIHGSDSHNLRNKINSTLKKNRSSESIQHEPFNKLTRSEFNEERDTPGNGREHQCAVHVKSEQFGEGKTLTTQHAEPDEYGSIAWYDVMFEHGIERVMTEDIEILVSEAHTHSKKKGMM